MTYPLPWRPGKGRPPGQPLAPGQAALLESWLASGLVAFATIVLPQPVASPGLQEPSTPPSADGPATRCVRVWQNRHVFHAYDDATGEVLATIPNPRNARRFTGTEVPPCPC